MHLVEEGKYACRDRGELIERIKRGKSPAWLAPLKSPSGDESAPCPPTAEGPFHHGFTDDRGEEVVDAFQPERPRSALHSGDFRQETDRSTVFDCVPHMMPAHRTDPWTSPAYPAVKSPNGLKPATPLSSLLRSSATFAHARPMSYASLSPSGVILQLPSSPLVYQSNASTDTERSVSPTEAPGKASRKAEKASRRHTISPGSYQNFRRAGHNDYLGHQPGPRRVVGGSGSGSGSGTSNACPYQAHQPRRSISSWAQGSSRHRGLRQARRPSVSGNCDTLPLHHAPMVGSYEESILRGRMSTIPSRPLNFVAQIGVLGHGSGKSFLKCPPHVSVPFPAVFYSYCNANGRISNDQPSPYVGHIDLEHNLKAATDEVSSARRRYRNITGHDPHHGPDTGTKIDEGDGGGGGGGSSSSIYAMSHADRRKREKLKRRSASPKASPKAPSGGCYRIPQRGQLQIVIKNPNKTAVKLFLVPYDLSDMEAGQKTFVRQRSYSAGPIIDMPLTSRTNLGTDRPEAALSLSDEPTDRPILRYLIHLNICCPCKGRFYLFRSIRVVFANRVPDSKEKLRNEVQLPEPKYSLYKPSSDALSLAPLSLPPPLPPLSMPPLFIPASASPPSPAAAAAAPRPSASPPHLPAPLTALSSSRPMLVSSQMDMAAGVCSFADPATHRRLWSSGGGDDPFLPHDYDQIDGISPHQVFSEAGAVPPVPPLLPTPFPLSNGASPAIGLDPRIYTGLSDLGA